MLLYNPRTKAVHEASCAWLCGTSTGSKRLDLNTFQELDEEGPFPAGAHRVSCCAPSVSTAVLPVKRS